MTIGKAYPSMGRAAKQAVFPYSKWWTAVSENNLLNKKYLYSIRLDGFQTFKF